VRTVCFWFSLFYRIAIHAATHSDPWEPVLRWCIAPRSILCRQFGSVAFPFCPLPCSGPPDGRPVVLTWLLPRFGCYYRIYLVHRFRSPLDHYCRLSLASFQLYSMSQACPVLHPLLPLFFPPPGGPFCLFSLLDVDLPSIHILFLFFFWCICHLCGAVSQLSVFTSPPFQSLSRTLFPPPTRTRL